MHRCTQPLLFDGLLVDGEAAQREVTIDGVEDEDILVVRATRELRGRERGRVRDRRRSERESEIGRRGDVLGG